VLHNFLNGSVATKTIFNGVPLVDPLALGSQRDTKRRELGLADSDCLVLGLGRLVQQKRPLLFLQTAKELHERFPAAKFLWVGEGELAEEWQRAVRREKLEDVVQCIGWQTNVQPYLLAADLLLHVAEFEGLPLAVIEAMAAGLPCAVTKELSSEVPLFDKNNVLFVDDIEGLVQTARDPVVRARVGQSGRRLVEQRLSVTRMAESYERLYLDTRRAAETSFGRGHIAS
jgi:glycosyltransferase involved in cell wall biosynthesis